MPFSPLAGWFIWPMVVVGVGLPCTVVGSGNPAKSKFTGWFQM